MTSDEEKGGPPGSSHAMKGLGADRLAESSTNVKIDGYSIPRSDLARRAVQRWQVGILAIMEEMRQLRANGKAQR
jgi:hypothetical protein